VDHWLVRSTIDQGHGDSGEFVGAWLIGWCGLLEPVSYSRGGGHGEPILGLTGAREVVRWSGYDGGGSFGVRRAQAHKRGGEGAVCLQWWLPFYRVQGGGEAIGECGVVVALGSFMAASYGSGVVTRLRRGRGTSVAISASPSHG
jgi:hypothetical protein